MQRIITPWFKSEKYLEMLSKDCPKCTCVDTYCVYLGSFRHNCYNREMNSELCIYNNKTYAGIGFEECIGCEQYKKVACDIDHIDLWRDYILSQKGNYTERVNITTWVCPYNNWLSCKGLSCPAYNKTDDNISCIFVEQGRSSL